MQFISKSLSSSFALGSNPFQSARAMSTINALYRRRKRTEEGPGLYKVLLTGGPCAGKTTILAKLTSHLDMKGYRVFSVPEAATMLASGGVMLNTSGMDEEMIIGQQAALLDL